MKNYRFDGGVAIAIAVGLLMMMWISTISDETRDDASNTSPNYPLNAQTEEVDQQV